MLSRPSKGLVEAQRPGMAAKACHPLGGRTAFTLIELLVVMTLILVIFAVGIGYIVFGQDNQHSVTAAQSITGAMLNAKQRARRDGLPTGIRILFANATDKNGNPAVWASQVQLVQQPEDYTAGLILSTTQIAPFTVSFVPGSVDFQGGAAYVGQIDEAPVQAGDYFTTQASITPHRINSVGVDAAGNPAIFLDSAPPVLPPGTAYAIVRGPRRLPSEDVIQLPPSIVVDDSVYPQPPGPTSIQLCQNLPQRTLVDSTQTMQVAEIVFAPSGAVIGQGTGADKVLLWLRDPGLAAPTGGAPLVVSVQIRTGLISVYPVAAWNSTLPFNSIAPPYNDPYQYARDGRASGM
jgi:prepilin-type N-terminal cleavage/methylation domain-containing protein